MQNRRKDRKSLVNLYLLHQLTDQPRAKRATPRIGALCLIPQYIGSSAPKNGPNDPNSYIMIVSGLLNPFSTILDFHDPYDALATLYKLESHGYLEFLAIFVSKMAEIAHFGGSFLCQGIALNRAILTGISSFWLFW